MSEGSGELEGARGESGPESSLWGRAVRFEEVGSELASVNALGGLWAVGWSRCPVLGPVVIWSWKCWLGGSI